MAVVCSGVAAAVQVSLLLEGVILGQPRQAERRHLDPMRHMQPDLGGELPKVAGAPISKHWMSSSSGKGARPAGDSMQVQMLARAST